MKKIFLFAFIAIISFASNNINATVNDNSNTESVTSVSNRSVTVYMIKKLGSSMWSKTTKSGEYDPDSNTITIGKETYSVSSNSYSGGGRENYDYQAAGIYFFNL